MWSSSYGQPLSFQKVLETNVLKGNLRIATRFPSGWNNGPMLAPGLAHWRGGGLGTQWGDHRIRETIHPSDEKLSVCLHLLS